MKNLILTISLILCSGLLFAKPVIPQAAPQADIPVAEKTTKKQTKKKKQKPEAIPEAAPAAAETTPEQPVLDQTPVNMTPVDTVEQETQVIQEDPSARQAAEEGITEPLPVNPEQEIEIFKEEDFATAPGISTFDYDPQMSLQKFLEEQKKVWIKEHMDVLNKEEAAEIIVEIRETPQEDVVSSEQTAVVETIQAEQAPVEQQSAPAPLKPHNTDNAKKVSAKQPVKPKTAAKPAAPVPAVPIVDTNTVEETPVTAQKADGQYEFEEPSAPWARFVWGILFAAVLGTGVFFLSKYQ